MIINKNNTEIGNIVQYGFCKYGIIGLGRKTIHNTEFVEIYTLKNNKNDSLWIRRNKIKIILPGSKQLFNQVINYKYFIEICSLYRENHICNKLIDSVQFIIDRIYKFKKYYSRQDIKFLIITIFETKNLDIIIKYIDNKFTGNNFPIKEFSKDLLEYIKIIEGM